MSAELRSYPGNPQFTFANGLTISIAFAYGNYCANRRVCTDDSNKMQGGISCANAEIAIWAGETWITFISGDQVLGYQNPDQVALWTREVMGAHNIAELQEKIEEIEQYVNQYATR